MSHIVLLLSMLCFAGVFGLPAKDAAKALKPLSYPGKDKCCMPVDAFVINQEKGAINGEPCTGAGACLLVEDKSPSCESGCFSCEIDPGHFTEESVCEGDTGIWCADVTCDATEPGMTAGMTAGTATAAAAGEATDKCCTLVDGGVINQEFGAKFQEPCTGAGACLLIEDDSPSCDSGCYSCEIDPGHFYDQSVCDGDHGIWCADVTCDVPTVHGDPMFKVNGKGTHFWLKAGELTPLLITSAITLSGRTFDREDTGNQWFDKFTVSNNGKAVLDVSMSNGQTVVNLDGKVVQTGKLNANGVEVEFGKEGTTFLVVKAGALAIDIYPSTAQKFSSDKDKTKYGHLNINFQSGIPKDSKGIFAEFAGVQEMSEATTALLKNPLAL